MQNLTQKVGSAFNLAMNRKPEMQYFHMQTQFIHLGFDGQRQGTETYLLTLRCIPAALSGEKLDHYTCGEFGLQLNSGNVVTIPDLHLWDYDFNPLMTGTDGNGPMFGIPHEIFEDTKDSEGSELPPDVRYAIYNNFIDFHALNDAFSRPMFGKGVDALKFIGDKIVHPAAFTEAPVSVGTTVKPGSVFRNGEVTLEFKGVSRVDGEVCALIGYDSGESTLEMVMASVAGENVVTKGGSEYIGDIYIDLETGWVRKVTLNEFVITETVTGSEPAKTGRYTVRHLFLRLISKEEFEAGVATIEG